MRLILMEEVLLLDLKDGEGSTSFWNDWYTGLHGYMLIELALRGQSQLKACEMRRKSFDRKSDLQSGAPSRSVLLDEVLNIFKDVSRNSRELD